MKLSFLAPLLKLIRNFKPSVKARLCHASCVFVLIGFIRAHHRACLINILLVKNIVKHRIQTQAFKLFIGGFVGYKKTAHPITGLMHMKNPGRFGAIARPSVNIRGAVAIRAIRAITQIRNES